MQRKCHDTLILRCGKDLTLVTGPFVARRFGGTFPRARSGSASPDWQALTLTVRFEAQATQPAQTIIVRLAEIDAPEKRQPFGEGSTQALAATYAKRVSACTDDSKPIV